MHYDVQPQVQERAHMWAVNQVHRYAGKHMSREQEGRVAKRQVCSGDVRRTKPSGRHIRRQHDGVLAGLKLLQQRQLRFRRDTMCLTHHIVHDDLFDLTHVACCN